MSYVQLLYVKEKVYVHPTTSKKDNVPGFLSLCKPSNATTNKDILLSFTPEAMLSPEELKIYQQLDIGNGLGKELLALLLGGKPAQQSNNLPMVSRPLGSLLAECFSVPLSAVYLVQFRTPSWGWWYGSIVIHTKGGEKLPVLFFHDDEASSSLMRQKVQNQRFDPFDTDGSMYWGGLDFLASMLAQVNFQQSTIEPSIYLVDPSPADLKNFSPMRLESKQAATKPSEPFKMPEAPDLLKLLATAKWKILETVATFGSRTKHQVRDIVDEHIPPSVVNTILQKKEVKKISDDFDSARVYLAKWAIQVKEEAEASQRKFMLKDDVYARINKELGDEQNLLTPEEVSNTSRRKPISLVEWNGFFDVNGCLTLTVDEVKDRVFHGGLEENVRSEAWPFLLGIFPWDSSAGDRSLLKLSLESSYHDFKRRWVEDDSKPNSAFWKDQKHRIEKDIHRNDRQLKIFQDETPQSDGHPENPNDESVADNTEGDDSEDDQEGWNLAVIRNKHLANMREILITYNEYNQNLGYVQGMTDLLSPIYVVFQDEYMSFWGFAGFMERMERNFVRDQSGMKKQMLVLNELVQFMLPDLFKHLVKCESTDLFFFFRMLLVWFKREFEWDETNTLWEMLWTDFYSSQYHLFIALAVLSDNERIIRQNLSRFDEVLKFMNDLLGNMKLQDLLIRAELLFLRFRRMIDLIDRENTNPSKEKVQINPDLRQLLSRKMVIQKESERTDDSSWG